MSTFSADISQWVAKAKANQDALVRQTVQEMAFRIVQGSPVDTGFFRACWWASINHVGPNPHHPRPGKQRAGGAVPTVDRIVTTIMTGKAGDVFYLLNNAEYAMPLEYGHSKQAPAGIVRPVVAAAPHIVEQVAAQLSQASAPP
jgi:hypothetical protein